MKQYGRLAYKALGELWLLSGLMKLLSLKGKPPANTDLPEYRVAT